MATKIHYLVSNATEAETAAKAIIDKIDNLRPLQIDYACKAADAMRDCQYQFYFCKFQIVDNQIIALNRALTEVATFLPMPSNFPQW